MNDNNFLNPKYGYSYKDLYDSSKLKSLTEDFYKYFESVKKSAFDEFKTHLNQKGKDLNPVWISKILIEASSVLSNNLDKLNWIRQ